jgi:dihydroorotate dehydrogenase
MEDLTCSYLGLKLSFPLIAGSSGLTDNILIIKKLEQYGAGAVVLKSLFEEEIVLEKRDGISRMSSGSSLYPEAVDFYEFDEGPEESTAEYLDLIRLLKKEISIPVIASINCLTAEQWTWFPKEIESAGALIKQILAGANAVQVASVLYRHGAEYIRKMLNDLIGWMKKHDRINISDFRGRLSQANIQNPAAYERVRFMKYFRGYEPEQD